jgi:hypothetical protein
MLTSQIKSNEIEFGSCNKDLLEEIIFYGMKGNREEEIEQKIRTRGGGKYRGDIN